MLAEGPVKADMAGVTDHCGASSGGSVNAEDVSVKKESEGAQISSKEQITNALRKCLVRGGSVNAEDVSAKKESEGAQISGSARRRPFSSAAVVVVCNIVLCSSLAVGVAAGPATTVHCGHRQDCATCAGDRRCGWCTFLGLATVPLAAAR